MKPSAYSETASPDTMRVLSSVMTGENPKEWKKEQTYGVSEKPVWSPFTGNSVIKDVLKCGLSVG